MITIVAQNVNGAYYEGLKLICSNLAQREISRNGPVLVIPEPVVTELLHPERRVLFSEARDANPFFHVMEALWMLAGENCLWFPTMFNSRFPEFSDDALTLHGAYGYRWRVHFAKDQLLEVREMIIQDCTTRRAVITMWDPIVDLNKQGKDFPCNTTIYFAVRNGNILDMTVCNRSNDIIWGLYGANAVHMSMLLEFMSRATGMRMGRMCTLSNNFHCYPNNVNLQALKDEEASDPYDDVIMDHVPLFSNHLATADFLTNVEAFVSDPSCGKDLDFTFLRNVAYPMYQVWHNRANREEAYKMCENILADDWRHVCREWILRRVQRESADNGS